MDKKEITKDQVGVPLPELVGAKIDTLVLDGKEYTKTSERWGKAFYRKGKVCLLIDLATGEIAKTIPTEKSLLTMGVVMLRGLIAGEFDSDEPITANTLKELMSSYSDDEKKAIWSQLSADEKKFLLALPKDPIRVEKRTLFIDQDLPSVLSKIPGMTFTDDIETVNYKGEVFSFFVRMGDVLEYTNEAKTSTLMVDIYTHALCLTEFVAPPAKKSKDGVEIWIGNQCHQLSHRHYSRLPLGFGQMSRDERVAVIDDMKEQDRLIAEAQEIERKKKEVWESANKKVKPVAKKKIAPKEKQPDLFAM